MRGRRQRRNRASGANHPKRGRFALIVMAALLVIVATKLVLVQAVDASSYAAKAQDQGSKTITLVAQRGPIYDRTGSPLAFTVEGRALAARPAKFQDDGQRRRVADRVLQAIKGTPLAAGITEKSLMAQLTSTQVYVYLVRGLLPDQADRIINDVRPLLLDPKYHLVDVDKDHMYRTWALNAVATERQDLREYPNQSIAESVIGRTGWDSHGTSGIENRYDATLAGVDGARTYEIDSLLRELPGTSRDTVPVDDGTGMTLTLDTDLQYTAQNMLQDAVARQCARGGDLLIQGATDGQIYAMASYTPGQSAAQTGNRSVTDRFEPGSVNKVVTFAAALDRGLIKPSTVLNVPGEISMGGITVHDAWSHDPVQMSATGVLAKSSNVGTLMIAQKLGEKDFYTQLRKMGLGQKTGVELNNDNVGRVPVWNANTAISEWTAGTFANLPIGQGLSMTMMQLSQMYQAIANRGVRIPPTLIKATGPADAQTPAQAKPGIRVMSAATAETLLSMLIATTQSSDDPARNGTGGKAAINGYLVAGKTGTAQQFDPVTGDYSQTKFNSTFAGIVPADNPKYVITIRLDAPCANAEGGSSAAPLFHRIAAYAMSAADIPPSTKTAKTVDLYVNQGG